MPLHTRPTFSLYLTGFLFLCISYVFYYYIAHYQGRWGSLNVDFGSELYVPWQILQGRILYRDMVYLTGPLSPYLNALFFKIFGQSIATLQTINLCIALLFSYFAWRIVSRLSDRIVATFSILLFFLLSVFSADYQTAIFSFIAPYSHEITHGLFIGFVSLFLVSRHLDNPSGLGSFLLGLCVGAALLTKPEIALAVTVSSTVGLGLSLSRTLPPVRTYVLQFSFFSAGALVVFGAALAFLSTRQPPWDALAGMTRMWRMVLDPRITGNIFYRHVMGTADLPQNLKAILFSGAVNAGIAIVILFCGRIGKIFSRRNQLLCYACILSLALFLATFLEYSRQCLYAIRWANAWPFLVTGTCGFLFFRTMTRIHIPQENKKLILLFVLSLFSFILLLKIFFFAQFFHYGNFLLVPTLFLYCILFLYYLPLFFKNNPVARRSAILGGLAVIAIVVYPRVQMTNLRLASYSQSIHADRETVFWDGQAVAAQQLVDTLQEHKKPNETLAVLPEGAMFNFLTKRPNPTPYINLMPPEWMTFGGDAIMAAYDKTPPDWIACISTQVIVYGVDSFFGDYGKPLADFINAKYDLFKAVEANGFSATLYRRKNVSGVDRTSGQAENIEYDPDMPGLDHSHKK
uniref:Uncharacterized protein n=1 Tax=Desulfovibrio sp. U5L TaxID=596152 RepID=I2Q3D0_9BACT